MQTNLPAMTTHPAIEQMSHSQTALGSFLWFGGISCYRFETHVLANNLRFASRAVKLAEEWKKYLGASGLNLEVMEGLDELSNTITQLVQRPNYRQAALDDFKQLFMAEEPIVPVRGSEWFEDGKTISMNEAVAMSKWYSRFNWEVARYGLDAPDHIGIETAFCGWLYDRASLSGLPSAGGSAKPNMRDVHTFLQNHFCMWAPQCYSWVHVQAQTPFWRSLLGVLTIVTKNMSYAMASQNGDFGTA